MALTRESLRNEVRELIAEPGVEKTWTDVQLNRYIRDALRELSSYGVFRGTSTITADGSAVYDMPSDMMCLVLVTIGETEYRPIPPGYSNWMRNQTDTVVVDYDPTDRTQLQLTFKDEITTDTEIECYGYLWHTDQDPEDEDLDDDVLMADDRFGAMLAAYVCAKALRGTEDDYKRFQEEWELDLQRFGLRAKISRVAQFQVVEKRYHNRSRY